MFELLALAALILIVALAAGAVVVFIAALIAGAIDQRAWAYFNRQVDEIIDWAF